MALKEEKQILDLFNQLRVADVRDGMDWNMMHHYGTMSFDIRPLFRAKAVGIARTCRYVAYEGPIPPMNQKEYTEWSDWYYSNVCTYPWISEIEDGDFIVIDQSGLNVGLMGSNNTLEGIRNGARGYVTNGGVRDTDEIILQNIPFWSKSIAQSMVQGRLRFDAKDVPVNVGGVAVYPGDIIVADGDGVIAVPRKLCFEVAEYASRELRKDKTSRRKLYEEVGYKLDNTVL